MREIFDAHSVTNEHARVPTPTSRGGPSQVNIVDDDSGCEMDVAVTPVASRGKGGKKRSCPYSPSPTTTEKMSTESNKNLAFERMVDIFERREKSRNSVTSQMTVDPVRQEFKEMMAQVVEDGGAPGSDEHFYATHLFMKKEYRDAFSCFDEAGSSLRLQWLRKAWKERKNN